MARKSLRPQLNQIRAWVRQGRTDAWVAHQLEVTVQEIEQFKRQNDLMGGEDMGGEGGVPVLDYPDEIDLRAEDDALIAAELEEAARVEAEAKAAAEAEEAERKATATDDDDEDGTEEEDESPRRRRGRRGGRGRRSSPKTSTPLEGTFDHGEEGYGLWLDPAVQDNPVYAEHWAGHRSVEVLIEEDQVIIRRVGTDD
jgi:hypothetical protein